MMTASEAERALTLIRERSGLILHPSLPYFSQAQALAVELGGTVYDCLYLALALAESARVITADAKFERLVTASSIYAPFLVGLPAG